MIESYLDEYDDLTDKEIAQKIHKETETDVTVATIRRDLRRVKHRRQEATQKAAPLKREIVRLQREKRFFHNRWQEEKEKRQEAEQEVEALESELKEANDRIDTLEDQDDSVFPIDI
jgi:chromosome segregation ATPase